VVIFKLGAIFLNAEPATIKITFFSNLVTTSFPQQIIEKKSGVSKDANTLILHQLSLQDLKRSTFDLFIGFFNKAIPTANIL